MIGKITYGDRFGGLSNYLLEEKKREVDGKKADDLADYLAGDKGRVDDIDFNNLESNDPNIAAQEMSDLVAEKKVVDTNYQLEKPVMHLSVSFHEQDDISNEKMQQIMNETLGELGLENHQAMTVIHNDTDHPHIHAMVNRINPGNYKAWGRSDDWRRFHEVMRKKEKAYGLTQVEMPKEIDGRQASQGMVHQAKRVEAYAKEIGLKDLDKKTIEDEAIIHRGRGLYDELNKAKSFSEFDNILSKEGLFIETSGVGSKITDGLRSVKSSSVSRAFGRGQLEDKFNQKLTEYLIERNSLVKDFETKELNHVWDRFRRARSQETLFLALNNSYEHHRDKLDRANSYLKDHNHHTSGLSKPMENIYQDGLQAFKRFRQRVNEVGYDKAAQQLRENPKQFGALTKEFRARAMNHSDQFLKIDLHWKRLSDLKTKYPEFSDTSLQQVKKLHGYHQEKTQEFKGKLDELSKKNSNLSLPTAERNVRTAISKVLHRSGLKQGKATTDLEKSTMMSISLAKDIAEVASNPAGSVMKLGKKIALRVLKQSIRQTKGRGR